MNKNDRYSMLVIILNNVESQDHPLESRMHITLFMVCSGNFRILCRVCVCVHDIGLFLLIRGLVVLSRQTF